MVITPVDDAPPVMPLTCQVTAVFEEPVTAAVNVCEAPARMVAGFGETLTEIAGGGGGGGGGAPGLPVPVPLVEPAQFA